MSIQYLPQGIPIVSTSLAVSSSYAILANNASAGLVATASLAGHSLHAIGLTGSAFITRSAETTLANTGSQGFTILVRSTGSLAFKFATSSFSTAYGPLAGQIDPSASFGHNPTLNLVSGRQYTFLIRGEPPTGVQSKFFVTNAGSGAYVFSSGATGNNQTLSLVRGYRYEFEIDAVGHPFWIQDVAGAYSSGDVLGNSDGVYNNGTQSGTIIFNVPHNAPNTLYYVCQNHASMAGTINIVNDGLARFRIQSTPSQSGTPYNTGVTNNNNASGSLKFAVTASAGTTLYYASPDSTTMNGTINIVS